MTVVRSWLEEAVAQAELAPAGSVPPFLANRAWRGSSRAGAGVAYVAAADTNAAWAGTHREPFSLQSLTKVFSLAIALSADGDDVWNRVSYGAPMLPFDSPQTINRGGRPNPFVNAGALLITDRLHQLTGDAAAAVRDFIVAESDSTEVDIDESVAHAEAANSGRNAILLERLASTGALRNPPDVVLEQYLRQCAIAASCLDVATAALFLARLGRGRNGRRVLSALHARQLVGLLSLSGTYDASAEVMFRIGLPAKSGIGGGILAVLSHHGVVCAASPGLDKYGTSIGAGRALEVFSHRFFDALAP